MRYGYHSTVAYHSARIQTLGWELTLCNALEPSDSPCRTILTRPSSYGELLYDYLARFFPANRSQGIVEIGGGYGFLMRDFLRRHDFAKALMIDISPLLTERQREMVTHRGVEHRCEDFLETPDVCLQGIDIAIMNENLGDFPTLTGLNPKRLRQSPEDLDPLEKEAARYLDAYDLCRVEESPYSLNIGALSALEKLCLAGIPLIYMAEHSCEARVPSELEKFISVRASGDPERIPLYGHDEYTIRFSDLVAMAKAFGYAVKRGPLADIIVWKGSESLYRRLSSPIVSNDRGEIIRQFMADLYQYEYLIMTRS